MADRNIKLPLVYCFLDTNILLEFQTFDEIKWLNVFHAKKVILVIAPVVLRELDKHKTSNNVRLQKRARMLLPKLNIFLEIQAKTGVIPEVRKNVFLMALPKEPTINWKAEGLEQQENDDNLLASIVEFKADKPSEKIVLLSDDSGPRFKAISRQIETKIPEEDFFSPITIPTTEELEIRTLKRQLNDLTERMPKLKLGFYERGQVVDEIIRSKNTAWVWQTPEDYMREKIAQERKNLASIIAKASDTVQKAEVQKFTKEYEKYLEKLEKELKMEFIKNFSPYCTLQLMVINEGSAPGNGVGVNVMLPKGASLITTDSLADEVKIESIMPDEPDLPDWAKTPVPEYVKNLFAFQNLSSTISSLSRGLSYTPPGSYKHSYFYEIFPFERNTTNQKREKLSHHERWHIKPMVIYLPPSTSEGFSINYSIYADEFLEPIVGELKVKWEQDIQMPNNP